MKCFYHSADLDGKCSAAIVKHKHPGYDISLIGIDYGQEFPWETISKGEFIYMVDFALQPFSDMIRLNETANLVWIDHHKTAMDDEKKYGIEIDGLRRNGIGACELTWEYLFHGEEVPVSVQLLSSYDTWNRGWKPKQEVWVSVSGWEGLYSVSQFGNVRSEKTGTVLSPSPGSSGYPQVSLRRNGHQTARMVHRIVAEAFLRRSPFLNEVNHVDGNKENNSLENLEWSNRWFNLSSAYGDRIAHGVRYIEAKGKFASRLQVGGVRHELGFFDSLEDASDAYDDFVEDLGLSRKIPLNRIDNKPSRETSFWDSMVLPFQYGMRLSKESNSPCDQVWPRIFRNESVETIIERGFRILKHEAEQSKIQASAKCFDLEFDGLRCLAMNHGPTNSKVFDSVWDPEKYDAMMPFYWNGKVWKISLYSDRDDVDVSKVAKARGGGGHKGAAGFPADKPPMEL